MILILNFISMLHFFNTVLLNRTTNHREVFFFLHHLFHKLIYMYIFVNILEIIYVCFHDYMCFDLCSMSKVAVLYTPTRWQPCIFNGSNIFVALLDSR